MEECAGAEQAPVAIQECVSVDVSLKRVGQTDCNDG